VDWWLKKWGRDAVVAGTEPLTREDVERLIEANGGTAAGLYLPLRDLRGINLGLRTDQEGKSQPFKLQGIVLADSNLKQAELGFANFNGADLARCNFQGAGLYGADLRQANLFGADLHGANLREAKLQGSRLAESDLHNTKMWWVEISRDTDLEGVKWDKGYFSVLEREGDYEAATALYRRLKEWYRGAGMLTIAGEFHYREQEANRKAQGRRLGRQFKEGLAAAWRRLRGEDVSAPTKE
jgi:hypothetical protein